MRFNDPKLARALAWAFDDVVEQSSMWNILSDMLCCYMLFRHTDRTIYILGL